MLILRTENGYWGFSIDRRGVSVEGACDIQSDTVPPIPGGFVTVGAVERDGLSHAILDPERTWKGLRSEIDRWYRDARGFDTLGVTVPRPG